MRVPQSGDGKHCSHRHLTSCERTIPALRRYSAASVINLRRAFASLASGERGDDAECSYVVEIQWVVPAFDDSCRRPCISYWGILTTPAALAFSLSSGHAGCVSLRNRAASAADRLVWRLDANGLTMRLAFDDDQRRQINDVLVRSTTGWVDPAGWEPADHFVHADRSSTGGAARVPRWLVLPGDLTRTSAALWYRRFDLTTGLAFRCCAGADFRHRKRSSPTIPTKKPRASAGLGPRACPVPSTRR